MLNEIHESEWQYNTSASAGVSLGTLLMSGGMFVLEAPSKKLFRFSYQGLGLSMGEGLRLPERLRLPEIALPKALTRGGSIAGAGATPGFQGGGIVFYTGNHEPTPTDFEGLTLYVEFSAGVLYGGSISGFFTGLRKEWLIPCLFAPALFSRFLFSQAAPFILIYGATAGLLDGLNLGLMCGSITYNGPYEN